MIRYKHQDKAVALTRIMMPHMNLMIVNNNFENVDCYCSETHTHKTRFCSYSLMFSRSSGNTTIRLR